jgi:LPXTG-site transpeptidase (sortase) family protein
MRTMLLILLTIGTLTSSALPGAHAAAEFTLSIPALKLDLPVITATFKPSLGTWDFLPVRRQAAHLEHMPLPGQGGNVVMGAHRELEWRRPGPFFRLAEIKRGDMITVTYAGQAYQYRVFHTWIVTVDDIRPLRNTRTEVLTLITCDTYNRKTGGYDLRMIVRAKRIRAGG